MAAVRGRNESAGRKRWRSRREDRETGRVVLSKVNMKFLRTMGALMLGAGLGVMPAWCVPAQNTHTTTLTQPTAKQMQSIRKMLGEQKPQAKKTAKAQVLLPAKFDGWMRGGVRGMKPKAANAAALKEFGLQRGAQAEYSRGGDRVAVRVWKFPDATGAYGTFTLFRAEGMKRLRIGADEFRTAMFSNRKNGKAPKHESIPLTFWNGARAGEHFLFWKGDLLVDARFAQPVTDEAGVMTRLAKVLPEVMGPMGTPPTLPEQLPVKGLDRSSVRYAIGEAAYKQEGGVLPASVLDFDTDAEVVIARYGKGTLTVISYPTPQIAQAREAAIGSAMKHGAVPSPKVGERVKRAGPLVAVTGGEFTGAEADALLKRVQFEGTVAMDQLKPQESEAVKAAKLLIGIASLTIILGIAAVLLGFFLGGGRALYRMMKGKPASSAMDEEFIALDLNKRPAASGEAARD